VAGVTMTIGTFLATYQGGWPTSRTAWIAFFSLLGGAAWGGVRRWLATRVANVPIQMVKPAIQGGVK